MKKIFEKSIVTSQKIKMILRNSNQKMSINTWLINFILLSNTFSIVLGENITNTNLGGEDDNESEDIFYVVAMS